MHQLTHRSHTKGITFLGFLVSLILLIMIATVIVRVTPSYLEYQSIKRAVNWAKQNANNKKDAMVAFDKQAQLDQVESIHAQDLDIEEANGGVTIGFKYHKEIALYGPVSLLITYENVAK